MTHQEELVVLGTGNAAVTECYNTCFALRQGDAVLLVDAGGGNGILTQLKHSQISLNQIHDIFITHQHCDHLLGVIWLIRMIAQSRQRGAYSGVCRIYCHSELAEIIPQMARLTLQPSQTGELGEHILIVPVENGETREAAGWPVTFFDIHSTKVKQFGCSVRLHSGRKLTCLGDEPYSDESRQYIENSDWLLSEAFCLYAEAERFKPYEKHHSTVREACELASRFDIPHLVLWHTEQTHLPERKALYTAEGSAFYSGDLHVPDDLEVIPL